MTGVLSMHLSKIYVTKMHLYDNFILQEKQKTSHQIPKKISNQKKSKLFYIIKKGSLI